MSIVPCFSVRHFRLKIGLVALMAILTLAAGTGATAATASVTDATLSNWLPGQHPPQLYFLRVPTGAPHGTSSTGGETTSFSLPVFEALRRDRRVFSDVMAFAPLGNGQVVVHANDVPDEATGEMVSGNFFSGLGVRMRLGGGFRMEDERRHTPVVVLSFAYWTHLYSRDPDVAGRTIYVQGVPFAIVGVTAEGFSGVDAGRPTDLWIPLQSRTELNPWGSSQTLYGSPNWWCLRLMARLSPGMDVQRAVAEATPGFQAAAYAGLGTPSAEDPKVTLAVVPATGIQGVSGGKPEWIRVLMTVLAALLLIACGYVATRMKVRRAPDASGVKAP